MVVRIDHLRHATVRISRISAQILRFFRGFHPFDPNYDDSSDSYYPYDNLGRYHPPTFSEEIVQRRIVQKHIVFDHHDWKDIRLGSSTPLVLLFMHGVSLSSCYTALAASLIGDLLTRDFKVRETIEGALQHEWIQVDLESLTKAYQNRVEREYVR